MSENKYKTYHLMILDKSGSMDSVRDVTISGLNEQLQSIRQSQEDHEGQEQKICFVTFNNHVEHSELWNKGIGEIEDFTNKTYSPTGGTALREATIVGINKLKNEIKDELAERKANVIVTVFTDGYENASSREHTQSRVLELVKKIQGTGQWTVAFIGCGDNVFEVAESMGIGRGNTLSYESGVEGTQSAFSSMAASRSMRTACYASSIEEGINTEEVNQTEDFFGLDGKKINLDTTASEDLDDQESKNDEK